MKKSSLLILAVVLIVCMGFGNVYQAQHLAETGKTNDAIGFVFPDPDGYINDFNYILSEDQVNELDSICSEYDKKTTNQLVVTTIGTYSEYPNLKEYSTDMFNEWKIGTKEKNNGLLIVFCKDCQQVRITTGLGTEKILTQEKCDETIKIMLSFFKESKYYEGLKAGILDLISKWK
jgi:uncharacterized protein